MALATSAVRTLELVVTESLHPNGALLIGKDITPDPTDRSIRRATFGRHDAERWTSVCSHIWWKPPHCIRTERKRHGVTEGTVIVREDHSFVHVPQQRLVYTDSLNEPGPSWESISPERGVVIGLPSMRSVLRSSLLLSLPFTGREWSVREVGEGERLLGRATRRVQAERRQTDELDTLSDAHERWSGVDGYRCDIDDDLGIGLQLTALRVGEPVAYVSVDYMRVDGAFSEDLFTITPPSHTRIMRVVRWSELED